ncbi:YrhB domain-containing protein [Kitasatospora sp. NPDC054939]
MIEFAEAHRLALDYVRNLSAGVRTDLVLLDEEVGDEGWCWVFPYDSRAHRESGGGRGALVRAAPLVVVKETGTLHALGDGTMLLDDALALLRPSPGPTATGLVPGAPVPAGLTRAVPLNRAELPVLLRHLGLPPPAPLSPVPDLLAADLPATSAGAGAGPVREAGEILGDLRELSGATVRNALTPLLVPDRVLDARSALFGGEPTGSRLYASRRCGDLFTGLRPAPGPHGDYDYELLAPYTRDDLVEWTQSQARLSAAVPLAPPAEELDAEELAFLLALVDAYKTRHLRSLADRQPDRSAITLTSADVVDAQDGALRIADRHWLTRAVGEVLGSLVRPGGHTGLRLPTLTLESAERQLRRYADLGDVERTGTDEPARYTLSVGLSVFAGTLFSWITLLSLHDVQLTGVEGDRPIGQEELLVLVATGSTLWVLLSEGLTLAPDDWSRVRFALRSPGPGDAARLADEFLRPLPGISLPDEVYAPMTPPVPPPPPPAAEPVWRPTHQVPEGGMPAWPEPDPAGDPATRIDARVELRLLERRGDWAHIVCSNGWSAWVDGRTMDPLGRAAGPRGGPPDAA